GRLPQSARAPSPTLRLKRRFGFALQWGIGYVLPLGEFAAALFVRRGCVMTIVVDAVEEE
ncbi:MAG: hypothetical protein AB7U20_09305, partial [Planctomycetaceae bacterium]